MKRMLFILLAVAMSTTLCSAAMSNSKIRKETLFLSDKMAHEMNLSTVQYNDVYEINYDFIASISHLMDDVLRGEEWALNRYYDFLDVRNDDLRWVLSNRQYNRFMRADYFYRPVYINRGRWSFRIYITYTNRNLFYCPRPYHYRTYNGGHYRTHHNNSSFYRGRHNHSVYNGTYRLRDSHTYTTARRSDFGSIKIRPNSNVRPRENVSTRRNSSNSTRERVNSSSRPANQDNRRSSSSNSTTRRTKVENDKTKDNQKSSRGNKTRVSTSNSTRRGSSDANNTRSSDNSRSAENKGRR